jgi:DNA modification methylase
MTLKKAILEVMDRDDLKVVIDDFELECADRRSREEMDGLISRSRRVAPSDLLQYLSESQVKQVCERMGIDETGRRGQLIHRLLGSDSVTLKKNKETRKDSAEDGAKTLESARETSQPESLLAPVRLPDPPPGMLRVAKTELVWPGKYSDDGGLQQSPRVSLPFQVIESVNQSRATRDARRRGIQTTLFDIYEGNEGSCFESGWTNKLIWGDNLLVMHSLVERFAGKVDLIYIDPPFATGADFSFVTQIGECTGTVSKEHSLIEEKAYRDTWGRGINSYLDMLYARLRIAAQLLSATGSLYVHIGPSIGPYAKVICDEIFGTRSTTTEIIWKRVTAHGDSQRWGVIHDYILFVTKSDVFTYNPQFTPYSKEYIETKYTYQTADGRKYSLDNLTSPHPRPNMTYEWRGHQPPANGWRYEFDTMERLFKEGRIELAKKNGGRPRLRRFLDEMPGAPIGTVWTDIPPLNSQAVEDTGYDTQKPEALLTRIIKTSSAPGSLVADFFCGSGTTLAVAEKLGRRWIGCDLGRWGMHVTRKRMLEIQGCKPFEVLNLGKYERQYWQGITFGREPRETGVAEQSLYEYIAFILKLYGAQPVPGCLCLHGKKGRALVHIGAVDAPVTIAEIDAAVDECSRLKQPELHVLGWEWEMGLHDLMVEAAKKKGVKLLLLQIPREVMEQQAAAKGDVRFFELAYLEAEISQPKKLTARVTLQDFVIQNSELIPDDVRSKVKKWSDYIDYWAIDWDFRNDTFLQGWVAYRTRKDRSLPLTSDPHTYPKPGKYRILVKVIDIFGNDTSQAFDVEIKG